jgi:putative addiction module component (TIGR02574 family)
MAWDTEPWPIESRSGWSTIVFMSTEELRDAALTLPRKERAKLAHELLRSLDEPTDRDAPDIGEAWAREVERRARELADGSVQPVDWEAARERIARRLRERRR